MKLSIIVPVYNEAHLIHSFWAKLKKAPIDRCAGIDSVEVLIIDDGSTDGTTDALAALTSGPFKFVTGPAAEVRFLPQAINRGKGYCVRTGIASSRGDVVLIQDSDLEYSPDDYPALIAPIVDDDADAVFGSRFVGTPRRILYFWHSLVNYFLTLVSNMVNNINITDMETCYKVMRGNLARSLKLKSNRFGIEPELTARLAKSGARLYEVPISYRGRTYDEGKKIGALDGVAALFHILRFGLIDTESHEPGLMQTLTALDSMAGAIYAPLLRSALTDLPAGKKPLKILEVGSGIGSLTKLLLQHGHVTATDISEDYVRTLKNRFAQHESFQSFIWDATHEPRPGMGGYDLIVSFNVLEHLEDDRKALRTWNSLLAPGGSMILLVPCGPRLYSPIDKALGHFRRYTKTELHAKLAETNFKLQRSFFGNAIGILGWVVTGLVMRRAELPAGQLRSYIMIKRLFGWLERQVNRYTGLSIIVVARRPAA